MSPTLPRLQRMLQNLANAARARGLELHPDKTKIISNVTRKRGRSCAKHVEVLDRRIAVWPFSASVKYLGRKITFDCCHPTEVSNRIACAWRSFVALRDELTKKHYSLSQRLRLFDMTVSATMLYGSAAWTLTTELEAQIRRTRRKMLRMILRYPRRVCDRTRDGVILEPWVDWIQRTTHAAEERMTNLSMTG